MISCTSKNSTVINKDTLNVACLRNYSFVAIHVDATINMFSLPLLIVYSGLSFSPYIYWWFYKKKILACKQYQ